MSSLAARWHYNSTERRATVELASPFKALRGPEGSSGSAAQHGWVIAIPDTKMGSHVPGTMYPKVNGAWTTLSLIRKHMSISASPVRLSSRDGMQIEARVAAHPAAVSWKSPERTSSVCIYLL